VHTSIGGGTVSASRRLSSQHRNGDLLIISDFSNGGTTSTISVFKWNNAVNGNLQFAGVVS
jgi:hypothetical protein